MQAYQQYGEGSLPALYITKKGAPLSLLLREIKKKGETFASLLNIEGGDIHVVLIRFFDFWCFIATFNNISASTTLAYE
jgi:hypothetical protein